MQFTELSRREVTTVFTLVEFDFDWVKVTVDIPHVDPKDEAEITRNIENRAVSEQEALETNE